jgi:hypothetical protein
VFDVAAKPFKTFQIISKSLGTNVLWAQPASPPTDQLHKPLEAIQRPVPLDGGGSQILSTTAAGW